MSPDHDVTLKSYTVHLCEREGDGFLSPILFACSAEDSGHAEEQAVNAYPGCDVIMVACDAAFSNLPSPPPDDRFNPIYYSQEELRSSLECNDYLLGDYQRGVERGGSMDWEDVDATHGAIHDMLPRLVRARNQASKNPDDEMLLEPVEIERRNEYEYQVHNLPRNDPMWLQVENFDVQNKRTDEGLDLNVFDFDDEARVEPLAGASALDSDTRSFAAD